jgi:hypothetical protein
MSTNPYDSPETATRKMSGTTKLLVGLGVGCATVGLLCCGGFAAISFLTGDYTSRTTNSFASAVRGRTAEIADMELPERLSPVTSVQASRSGQASMTCVAYADSLTNSSLAMAEFDQSSAENMRGQLDDSLGGALRREELLGEESEKLECQIHGQQATFTVIKGTGQETQQPYWRASGTFRGKNGPAILVLQLRSPNYTKQQLIEVLKSIH